MQCLFENIRGDGYKFYGFCEVTLLSFFLRVRNNIQITAFVLFTPRFAFFCPFLVFIFQMTL